MRPTTRARFFIFREKCATIMPIKSGRKGRRMEKKQYSIAGNVFYMLKLTKEYEPKALWMAVVDFVCRCISPVFSIFIPKIAVDMVLGNGNVTWLSFCLFLGMGGLVRVIQTGMQGTHYLYINEVRSAVLGLLFDKSLRIPYEKGEQGEALNEYLKATEDILRGDGAAPSVLFHESLALLTNLVCFGLYSAVIGQLSVWMLAAIILLSLVDTASGIYITKIYESVREKEGTLYRKYCCVGNSMGDPVQAKDVRMFAMNNWLVNRRNGIVRKMKELEMWIRKRVSMVEKLRFVTAFIRDMSAYVFLVYQVTMGAITLSEFVLLFGAVTGFSAFVESLVDNWMMLRKGKDGMNHVRTYLEQPDEEMEQGHSIEKLTFPISIEFKNVSYSYKIMKNGSSYRHPVLSHFSMKLEAGERVALVGVNGAGKSTIVKLLTGIYEPDEGQILYNGIPAGQFAKKEIYRLFSVVFQEHFMMPVYLGENIALQRLEKLDEKKVWEALEKAGMKNVLEEKNITLDRFVTRYVSTKGVDFSGGQKQRLMLARALYKDAPVLVLDEPTAALDPIAESEIYDDYARYTQDKTALFISHRFASTRFSDRILLLEQGEILESGTHEELMEKNGRYAELFNVQSRYYEEGGEKADE